MYELILKRRESMGYGFSNDFFVEYREGGRGSEGKAPAAPALTAEPVN